MPINQIIRLSLPSKGPLENASLEFLSAAGLQVHKTNPRQYMADIPALPDLGVLFQHPNDIVGSVRQGSVDFGITGMDVIEEQRGDNHEVLIMHNALDFGHCALTMAVPESWESVKDVTSLKNFVASMKHPLRVATKFPNLTGRFLNQHNIPHSIIVAEGTLEIAPTVGYADVISDLVSSGQTLKDNRLLPLPDGIIQSSQAALIANRKALQTRPTVLEMARLLLEYIEAHLRANENLLVMANIRGDNPDTFFQRMSSQIIFADLHATILPITTSQPGMNGFVATVVVRREILPQVIAELRLIGSGGIIVSPITFIFEEEPPRYKAMLNALS